MKRKEKIMKYQNKEENMTIKIAKNRLNLLNQRETNIKQPNIRNNHHKQIKTKMRIISWKMTKNNSKKIKNSKFKTIKIPNKVKKINPMKYRLPQKLKNISILIKFLLLLNSQSV